MHISFQKVFFAIASLFAIVAVLILAKGVLMPLAFALLIAFILFPVTNKIHSWGINDIVAAVLPIIGLFLLIGGAIFVFSNQIIHLSENLAGFKIKILNIFTDVTLFINQNIEFLPPLEKGELLNKIKVWLNDSSGSLLSQTFSSTASFIFGVLTVVVYTFLILLYRRGLVSALVAFYPKVHRDNAYQMFKSVQQVGKQYLIGMTIIIFILGIVNSLGLWIIGIDNPFLFGFLAAILAIIPYAGTFIGAAIPVIYAFISYESIWVAITVAAFFWLVQFIESNFLTPKIVGGNLKINAFTAIFSIIIGGSIWGVAGMIIFLPLAAMLKVVCEEYEELKPIALLIGDHINDPKSDNINPINNFLGKIKP